MSTSASKPQARSKIAAVLFYRDAPAALDWLERVFGFRRRLVVPGPDGSVVHAELTLDDNDVLMVASARPEEGWLSPRDLPGTNQSLCLVVDDPDAAYARAKAAGMVITREIKDEDYGSRGFTGRDLEGHTWSVASYRAGAWWDREVE